MRSTPGWITWIVVAAMVASCGGLDIPDDLRTPTVVGVVEESTQLANGRWEFRLTNGEVVGVDFDRADSLLGGPQVGRLLLAGEDRDGGQWVAGLPLSPNVNEPGCFWLTVDGRDADDWIETTNGLRLPKASDFDPGLTRDGEYTSERGYFCLNGDGKVTGYVFA